MTNQSIIIIIIFFAFFHFIHKYMQMDMLYTYIRELKLEGETFSFASNIVHVQLQFLLSISVFRGVWYIIVIHFCIQYGHMALIIISCEDGNIDSVRL